MDRGLHPAEQQPADHDRPGQPLAARVRIVSQAAGQPNTTIAEYLHLALPTVRKWRERFAHRRLEGLADEPRPGTPRSSRVSLRPARRG